MRIAAFDDQSIGIVGNGETVVDITDLVERYEPLRPGPGTSCRI